ncbi:MAG: hypothetical protein AAFY99_08090 [Pseudomonadota bacterium]
MTIVPTEKPVNAVVETPRGVYVETGAGTFRLTAGDCEGGVCLTPDVIRGLPKAAPEGALPDGKIAVASEGIIRQAWFADPTERYQHCILGDCIEAGSLVAVLEDGSELVLTLPGDQVFEDLTPRLFDIDNDGNSEVITIRASNTGGAAVVIYAVRDGALSQIAASTENGQRNRWLNIAFIDTGSVAFVRTPHIGGRLALLQYRPSGEVRETNDVVTDISNHLIGSRELDLQEPFQSGSLMAIAIPNQDRDALRLIRKPGDIMDVPVPGKIDKAVVSVGNYLVTATEDGKLLAIEP